MRQADALALLGLTGCETTPEAVAMAFQRTVKATHPDAGGAGADMDKLKQARDALLNRRNVSDFACKQCSGRGTVPARLGVRPCGACRGTGERHGS